MFSLCVCRFKTSLRWQFILLPYQHTLVFFFCFFSHIYIYQLSGKFVLKGWVVGRTLGSQSWGPAYKNLSDLLPFKKYVKIHSTISISFKHWYFLKVRCRSMFLYIASILHTPPNQIYTFYIQNKSKSLIFVLLRWSLYAMQDNNFSSSTFLPIIVYVK